MLVFPVLDLKGGEAVHAVRGERVAYKPVKGILGDGTDAFALAVAYRDQLGSDRLYVADLDAIAGLPGHVTLLRSLAAAGLDLWVDAGVSTEEQAQTLIDLGVEKVIVGSETLQTSAQLASLAAHLHARSSLGRIVLSVDLKDGVLRAPPEFSTPADLLQFAADLHIDSFILLDLARVGATAGPPLDLLVSLHQRFPTLDLYAGGGVRDRADLKALERAGAAGALVATAFHRGVLGSADVKQ